MAEKSQFEKAGRAVYINVDLDAISNNVKILRRCCKNPNIGVIGVVKAGAYGHGSLMVAKHLKSIGVERLAVATVDEGQVLRSAGIEGPIHVFGNVASWEMASCVQHWLTPTVSDIDAIEGLTKVLKPRNPPNGSYGIHIKIDSGMSRNGCQPQDLPKLVQCCEELGVPIEGMLTHFAEAWGDREFTQHQLDTFLKAVQPYRSKNILLHVANSAGTILGFGTDLDFIRPGISLYGLPPDASTEEDVQRFSSMGFQPAMSIVAKPSLVKLCGEGTKVGYGCKHVCQKAEWIATIPIGYADGYWRHNSSKGMVKRDKTGELCPVVGRVSMDAITIQVPSQPEAQETFSVLTADFDTSTSATAIASSLGTITYEVGTRMSCRLPRFYTTGKSEVIVHGLEQGIY